MGIEIWLIIINILLSHFFPPKSHYFLFSISVEFHQETKNKNKKKRTASQDQQLLIRETIKSFQWLLLHHPNWRSDREKFHLGRKEKKRAKKSRNLKLFNGFFFFFFSFGWKKFNLKSYPLSQML
jgi:hypothetical protein